MKKLLFILLPAVVFAQAPYRNDTTVTLYYAANTSYISLATAVSRGLYDDANAERNPTRYPDYVTDSFEDARLPIEKVRWDGFTHAVLFYDDGNVSQTSPYYEFAYSTLDSAQYLWNGYGGTTNFMENFIDSAKANGLKVLTVIQAVNSANLNYVTNDSSRIDVFADTVGWFTRHYGFDGISLNWEGWQGAIQSDTNKIAYLLYRLREELDEMDPPGVFEMAPGAADYNYRYPRQAVNDCVDINHLQLYIYTPGWDTRYGRGTAWWECPVYTDSFDPANFNAISGSWGPTSWLSRGYDVRNTGLLFPAIGRIFKGIDSIYGLYWTASGNDSTVGIDVTYQDIARLKANGGTDTVSATTFGYAVRGTAVEDQIGASYGRNIHAGWKFFATFMDSTNIAKAVEYGLDSLGITHFAMFSMTNDPAQIAFDYFKAQFSLTGGGVNPEEEEDYAITGTLANVSSGVAYLDTLHGVGPNGQVDLRMMYGRPPPGIWVRWDGVLQGVCSVPGTYSFSVRVLDRFGRERKAWQTYSITVN